MNLKIIGTIAIVAAVMVAGIIIYGEHQIPKSEPIPSISNATLTGVSITPENASYVLNFSSPFSINPHWIELSTSSGSYASLLTYSGFSSRGFEFTDLSGFPSLVSVRNWNGSSNGIFSDATININSWSVPGHAFTKYGFSLQITYDNNTSVSATLNPISISGSLTYLKTYFSTAPDGQNMTVAQVKMDYNPSPLSDVSLTVQTSASYYELGEEGYVASPTWPTNSSEITFTHMANNVTGPVQAYAGYEGSGIAGQIPSREILYVTAPTGQVNLNGAVVSLSSQLYAGSLEVTL